jgi:hypothetical protein
MLSEFQERMAARIFARGSAIEKYIGADVRQRLRFSGALGEG